MLNCLIIDDESHAIELLTDYVQNVSFLKLINATNDPIVGLKLINEGNYDIIFLDIEMPKISGLELLAGVQNKKKVIITSANRNYAADGYENDVFGFMVKPIRFERFLTVVQRFFNTIAKENSNKNDEYIFVKLDTKNRLRKVSYNDIIYVEGAGNYIDIHTATEKIVTYMTVRDFDELVPSEKFMRVQKSYVVAIEKIMGLEGNEIILADSRKVLVGESYRQRVNEFFSGFMSQKRR
jgi:two-component system, LytTR family, response regulator